MEVCPVPLPKDNPALVAWITSILHKNELLEENLRLLLHKKFGASSEKTSPDQQDLFNEAEQDQPEAGDEERSSR